MKLLRLVGLAAACSQPVLACDLCALYAASQAQGEVGHGPFAGVAEQFTYFGTVQRDGVRLGNPSGQYLESSIAQIFAGYNFNERFGVQVNAPIIYRYYKRPDGINHVEHGTEAGLGDVSLLFSCLPFQKLAENFTFKWTILGGVKFPTGSSDRIGEELQEIPEPFGLPSGIHGHDLTLGTGSYDGIVGTGAYLRSHRTFLAANVQYAIRTEGDFDYQFANDLTWSGGPGYLLALTHNFTISIQAVVSGEYKGMDTFRGHRAEDTGVTAVYLGPQISFTWAERVAIHLAADLPVSIDNTSLQTVPDYRIRAGVTWHF